MNGGTQSDNSNDNKTGFNQGENSKPGYRRPPVEHQFKPGQSGNLNPPGRPKGSRSFATIIKQLMDDEQLADKLITKKPGWWSNLPNKNMGDAIVAAMMMKAASGDSKAAAWLNRAGFGDKVTHDFEDSFFNQPQLVIKVQGVQQTIDIGEDGQVKGGNDAGTDTVGTAEPSDTTTGQPASS